MDGEGSWNGVGNEEIKQLQGNVRCLIGQEMVMPEIKTRRVMVQDGALLSLLKRFALDQIALTEQSKADKMIVKPKL